ncbi:thiopeptide-type bacteriocin biosynthesis protein [Streptomyces sp. NBC_01476]|uniref:thiopeptide-type bacteriocin biosynthesis protein n=1 Tax=Streptomyces sp. NBC_01476 TaxID=2903881 RepID=UPI002E3623B8|nr:thiopeptide-type bacteriocin biosynthesis protein [Streptomyces sp. NBC_01476]
MTTPAAPHRTVDGVLAVLAGIPLDQAAGRLAMEPADLSDAVEVYQAAGEAALDAQPAEGRWYQVHIEFPAWDGAEQTSAHHLGPRLQQLTPAVGSWWFIRKAPYWRLRCRPGPGGALADTRASVNAVLDSLTAAGPVRRWWETIYEPEVLAFGGPQGMEAAHDLFSADSSAILDYIRRRGDTGEAGRTLGRRELSVLLCSALFHGAGQEWHEQGDIWHRVASMRSLPADTPTHRLHDLTASLRRLMTVDTGPDSPLFAADRPLAFAAPWATAFTTAGRSLGRAAHDGTVERGLRDILAHHVIFHWNRLGLPGRTQAILARAAHDTVMNPVSVPPGGSLPAS